MRRILICSHQFDSGGISNVVKSLKENFVCHGYSVDVMAPSSYSGVDIPVPSLNLCGLPGSLSFWETATRIISSRADQYDLVMLHHPVLLNGATLSKRSLGKILVTFHGTYYGWSNAYRLHNLGKKTFYYSIATQIEKNLLSALSKSENKELKVTGVSQSTISELSANGYQGSAYFVPNAMPEACESLGKEKARDLLDQMGYLKNDGHKILLYIGRMDPQKQPLVLINFFRELSKYNPETKLILAGNGPLSTAVRKIACEVENVFYLGFIPEQIKHFLYYCCDFYISLSCYEGLPLAVLEAIAHGRPLVLSNILAHRWLLSENIGCGVLVNSLNPIVDLETINEFLTTSNSLSSSSDSSIKTRFSWSSIAKNYLQIANC